jgi:hypothetical protein
MSPFFRIAFIAVFFLFGSAAARAQTPNSIQALIAAGQEQTALNELGTILQAHPNSGVAWYLVAEARDAAGDVDGARNALAKADQFAPGLPFAKPAEVAALRAHLAAPAARAGLGVSPVIIVIVVLVGLFFLLRLFARSRRVVQPYPGYNAGGPMQYGPGGMPYGPGGGTGNALLSGLAAGAGFAVGERVIDGMMGGGRGMDSGAGIDPTAIPDRDDGLAGSPGWDSGSSTDDNSGGFDQGNSW